MGLFDAVVGLAVNAATAPVRAVVSAAELASDVVNADDAEDVADAVKRATVRTVEGEVEDALNPFCHPMDDD